MRDLAAVLARARNAHEGLMKAAGDTIRIHRPGPPVFDQATGGETPGADLVLYEGIARVKPLQATQGTEVQSGEAELRLRDYEVAVPWATTVPPGEVIRPGDEVLLLAAADPRLAVGAVLYVTGRQFGSLATAWRIYAEDREV
ncbi:DUF6093 family protein [Streptomyces sp. NPDC087422]|uniref:DUF6093 family protein n=1 Tax=Streptomyces sp. NPDC087422 TaxID=3365786 RepID=UPI00381AC38D